MPLSRSGVQEIYATALDADGRRGPLALMVFFTDMNTP
jgi:hypothetical protein